MSSSHADYQLLEVGSSQSRDVSPEARQRYQKLIHSADPVVCKKCFAQIKKGVCKCIDKLFGDDVDADDSLLEVGSPKSDVDSRSSIARVSTESRKEYQKKIENAGSPVCKNCFRAMEDGDCDCLLDDHQFQGRTIYAFQNSTQEGDVTDLSEAPVSAEIELTSLNTPPFLLDDVNIAFNLMPETAYITGETLNNFSNPSLLGFDKDTKGLFDLSEDFQKFGTTLGWNYIDGVCSVLAGIALYKEGRKKEAYLSMANGIQLIGTSWSFDLYTIAHSTVFMAPISFALATVVDLCGAVSEYSRAKKELKIEGWFDEKVKCVGELNQEIKKSNNKEEINRLKIRKTNALIEMGCRYRAHKVFGIEKIGSLDQKLKQLGLEDSLMLNTDGLCSRDDNIVNNKIQALASKRYTAAKINLPFKALSFVGMTLGAIASAAAMTPVGIAIAGAVICTVVATYYLMKLGYIAYNYKQNKKDADTLKTSKENSYRFFQSQCRKNQLSLNNMTMYQPMPSRKSSFAPC